MKTMKRKLIWMPLVLVLLNACDVIDDPIVPFSVGYQEDVYGPPPVFETPTTTTKNVLLEDFTAHQCGNCPDAGVIAEQILAANPGRVALIAIHAGNLAAVNPNSVFDTDWTTPEGNVYWDQLDFQANPLGRVNRSGGAGNFFSPAEWAAKTTEDLYQTATCQLQIALNYAGENNHLNIHVNGHFTSSNTNATNLVVLITESELYDAQLWYGNDPSTVTDYHFKHILRGSVTGALGLEFSAPGVTAGTSIQKDYTFTWNDAWNIDNVQIVAFVFDTVTGEVLNVVESHP
jgi:hypothetical protein